MTFSKSITVCFSKYGIFKGRASRSEFWWFSLFTLLLSWGATLTDPTEITTVILGLATLAPSLAVGARRLHDLNRSGWWQFIALTVIGFFLLFYWWAQEGHDEENEHGEPLMIDQPTDA